MKFIVPARQQLMGICLMAHVKNDFVLRHMKDAVKGQCNLHDSQIGGKMAAVFGNGLDDFGTDVVRQIFAFFIAQTANVFGTDDLR